MKHFANLNFRSVLLIVFSLLLFQTGFSQVNLTTPSYSQDFNGLPTTGTGTTNAWTNNSTITGWYSERASGTTTGTTVTNISAGSGTSATGALYSLGTGTGTDRTLGSACSGTFGNVAYGIRILNQTGNSISAITITYTGEQWRKENNAAIQKLQFAYKTGTSLTTLDATSITAGSFTAVTALDFSSPIVGATTATALDGNLAANRTTISNVVISLPSPLANGQEIMLKWLDLNDSGNDHIMGIDDLTITATFASPTLTATPTSRTGFTYVEGNGPSTAQSYTLSGSILSPDAGNITVTAPTSFEISITSATTGFADSQVIPYTGGALASTTIYARLKAGLVANSYSDDINQSGGGVNTPLKVNVSGSVTSVPPPVVTTTGTLTAFSTFVGNPVIPQSYTVSGTNLVSDITITAPAGFEIKTGSGAYASSLVLPQSSGSVATTTIDVRLINTSAGTFSGNITHATTNLSPTPTVAVSGTVATTCATPTNISVVRASIPEQGTFPATGVTATLATVVGRVTAIFGTNKFYVQDATGGIAIFSNTSGGVVFANGIALGDSVKVTGGMARFNGEAEFNSATCVNKVTGSGVTTTPPAIVFDANNPPSGVNLPTFLTNNEGKLVKIISSNIGITGNFASGSNYAITACNSQGDAEIRIDATATTIPSQPIPTVTQDITGVIGHYINASATVNILQLFPRTISDLSNSTITCTTPVASQSASCGPITFSSVPVDSTLDVTCWNVEWLGNTTTSPSALGPTNDAQQMTNVLSVLNNIKSDVFCIEEVCDHKQFIARVKTDLPKYKVRCQTKYYSHFFDSPEVSTDAKTFGQKVCFVYDSTVVSMVDTVSLLANQYGYNATPVATPYPNNWASGRLPFMFIGNINIGGKTKQVHFVGLHAKSGSDAASYARRKQDVIDLKAKLDTDYPTANIIMLGDYNDDLDTSIYVGNPSTYKNFVNDVINYKQISKSLSDCAVSSTAKYPDIIDHIMISNEIGVIPASGPNPTASASDIYYLEKTINVSRPINYVSGYTTTTSDHYPVNARFRFGLPTTPPATITSITTGNWSSPSTWDCNCVPTAASDVIVDTTHTVTVDTVSQAKTLNLKGTLTWLATFTLSLGM